MYDSFKEREYIHIWKSEREREGVKSFKCERWSVQKKMIKNESVSALKLKALETKNKNICEACACMRERTNMKASVKITYSPPPTKVEK